SVDRRSDVPVRRSSMCRAFPGALHRSVLCWLSGIALCNGHDSTPDGKIPSSDTRHGLRLTAANPRISGKKKPARRRALEAGYVASSGDFALIDERSQLVHGLPEDLFSVLDLVPLDVLDFEQDLA